MTRPNTPCPDQCNVLLVGGGGREHALAWAMQKSDRLGTLWVTHPQHAGLAAIGEACPHDWDPTNIFQLQRWCEKVEIDMVVVGPEGPLSEGIVDALEEIGCAVFGPCQAASRLESDKAFAKQIMRQAAVPTADARIFNDSNTARRYALRGIEIELEEAGLQDEGSDLCSFLASNDDRGALQFPELNPKVRALLAQHGDPCVIKASGLAAGKGVIVCANAMEALDAIDQIMDARAYGDAGTSLLIEEFLEGQELSVLALVDGRTIWILDPCQDHKQVGEGDVGPNTGGMGAYCPTPLVDVELLQTIEQDVLLPTIDALRREEIEYRGVLYAGLMLTPAGPKVLEFNCRFGDPECQPLMARFEGDLVEVLWATCTGRLHEVEFGFSESTACCVVLCSKGYPGPCETGFAITGLDAFDTTDDVMVFQAGTRLEDDGSVVTNGGRVLGVTALGPDLATARDAANAACNHVGFAGAFWRQDIGDRVLINAST
ncbi:MAG: phosphoribosylamine--glycine ligase [Phycisphaerales bacterium]|nr:phosphoribosylamine--glycine ligase [Phycisphaerales bacterium]